MPLNTGGLLLTTLAILDAEHSFGDDILPLIGLVVLWFGFTSGSGGLEDEDESEEAFRRGPYTLLKSIDTELVPELIKFSVLSSVLSSHHNSFLFPNICITSQIKSPLTLVQSGTELGGPNQN